MRSTNTFVFVYLTFSVNTFSVLLLRDLLVYRVRVDEHRLTFNTVTWLIVPQ